MFFSKKPAAELPPPTRRPTRCSETERKADQKQRNQRRLNHWRLAFIKTQGREPDTKRRAKKIMRPNMWVTKKITATPTAAGNANVVKMERRRTQYVGAHLPTTPDGPDAA